MPKELRNKHRYIVLTLYFAILLFAFNVHAGDVTLSWDAPEFNEDGSAIVSLSGYNLYYGTTSGNYNHTVHIGNATTYQIANLTEGATYYLAITAYDSYGSESKYSDEISITLDQTIERKPEIIITDSVAPVSDLHIPFGNVSEGHSSTQTVTVINDGNAYLFIGSIAQNITLSPIFSILDDHCSGQTLIPSAKCSLTVRFSPDTSGEFIDSFDIPSNDSDESLVIINLDGTGMSMSIPVIQVTDSVAPVNDLHIPFGSVTNGLRSMPEFITISNTGTASLDLTAIELSGRNTNGFFLDFNMGERPCGNAISSINPGGSCTFQVTFGPTENGRQLANIAISSNDPDDPQINVALSGSGASSFSNNAPSTPELVYPKNNQKDTGDKITFRWNKSKDSDNDAVSYTVSLCADENLTTGCISEGDIAALTDNRGIFYAGTGSHLIVILIFAVIALFTGNVNNKRKPALLLTAVIMTALILISCGTNSGGSSSGDGGVNIGSITGGTSDDEASLTVSGLADNSTYYWKVQANDGKGGTADSHTWRFDTD
jgi:hypothetical protein